ncbi:Rossmann-like domain-containing protein [Buchananella hordeovulneris]|uniref:DUF364 domain-containing protein n=1 Tax=Buchananella hordeovulneris TaxID=52770 RepID=A0A1Q5PTC0_9ACTO|nr:DUF364 domain-containing protein [Buchananella hordeovulneris]OKL50804.1 hypothetical protein BSZ40_10640 [Buchananella hordeovulneris]
MSDAWEIYDRLIEPIPAGVRVDSAGVGEKWCWVLSSEGGLGVALKMPLTTRPARLPLTELTGRDLREVAQLAKSWNFLEAGLGMAAINAWWGQPERVAAHGYQPCVENNWARTFHAFQDQTAGKRVAIIGHFPFAPAALPHVAELAILERFPVAGDYPDPASEYLLPAMDYVFITGSVFVNKTAPRLLELSRAAHTVLVGPSTPAAPWLHEYGVDELTAFVTHSPAPMSRILESGVHDGWYAYGHRMQHLPT